MALPSPWKHPQSGIFYTRVAYPEDVKGVIGKREYKVSLKTRSPAEAKQKHSAELEKFYSKVASARQAVQLTTKDIAILAERWFNDQLTLVDESKNLDEWISRSNVTVNGEKVDVAEVFVDPYIDALEGSYTDQKRLVAADVNKMLDQAGLVIPEASEEYKELINAICWKKFKLLQAIERRHGGDWSAPEDQQKALLSEPLSIEKAPPVTFEKHSKGSSIKDVYRLWKDEHTASANSQGSKAAERIATQVNEYGKAVDRFVELFGNMKVQNINRPILNQFKTYLFQIPSVTTNELKKMSVKDQIKTAKARNLKTLSAKTVKNNLHHVSAVLSYAVDNLGLIDINPAIGIKVAGARKKSTSRKDYLEEELTQIFSTPLFTQGWRPPQANYGEAIFWLPCLRTTLALALKSWHRQTLQTSNRTTASTTSTSTNTMKTKALKLVKSVWFQSIEIWSHLAS